MQPGPHDDLIKSTEDSPPARTMFGAVADVMQSKARIAPDGVVEYYRPEPPTERTADEPEAAAPPEHLASVERVVARFNRAPGVLPERSSPSRQPGDDNWLAPSPPVSKLQSQLAEAEASITDLEERLQSSVEAGTALRGIIKRERGKLDISKHVLGAIAGQLGCEPNRRDISASIEALQLALLDAESGD